MLVAALNLHGQMLSFLSLPVDVLWCILKFLGPHDLQARPSVGYIFLLVIVMQKNNLKMLFLQVQVLNESSSNDSL